MLFYTHELAKRAQRTLLHYFVIFLALVGVLGQNSAHAQSQEQYTYTINSRNSSSTFTLNTNQSLYIPAGVTFTGGVNWNGENCKIVNEGTWNCPGNVTIGRRGNLSVGTKGSLVCSELNLNSEWASVYNAGSMRVSSNCNTSYNCSIQNAGTCVVSQYTNNTGSIYNEGSWRCKYFNNNYLTNNCGVIETSATFQNNGNGKLMEIGQLTTHELINDGEIQGCTTGSGVGKLIVDTDLFSQWCRQNGSGKVGITGRLDLSRRNTTLLGAIISFMIGTNGWDVQGGVLGRYFSYNVYIASGGCGTGVLPVELTSFTAKAKTGGVELNWATASEQNNAYFLVERSADGVTFQSVAQVQGQGNTSAASAYRTVDAHPVAGTSYYRLKQVDQDGTAHYAPVLSVQVATAPTVALSAYPNPVADRLTLDLRGLTTENTTAQLRNLNGQVVLEQSVVGGSLQELNMQALPAGVYLLHVRGGEASLVQRVVKL